MSARANTDRVQFRDRRDRTKRIALGSTGRAEWQYEEINKKTRAHTRLTLLAYLYIVIIPPPKRVRTPTTTTTVVATILIITTLVLFKICSAVHHHTRRRRPRATFRIMILKNVSIQFQPAASGAFLTISIYFFWQFNTDRVCYKHRRLL